MVLPCRKKLEPKHEMKQVCQFFEWGQRMPSSLCPSVFSVVFHHREHRGTQRFWENTRGGALAVPSLGTRSVDFKTNRGCPSMLPSLWFSTTESTEGHRGFGRTRGGRSRGSVFGGRSVDAFKCGCAGAGMGFRRGRQKRRARAPVLQAPRRLRPRTGRRLQTASPCPPSPHLPLPPSHIPSFPYASHENTFF